MAAVILAVFVWFGTTITFQVLVWSFLYKLVHFMLSYGNIYQQLSKVSAVFKPSKC
jgi:hypothetical protein